MSRKIPFLMIYHMGNFDDLIQPGFLKKTLWYYFMDGVQLSQGYKTTTRRQSTFYH